MVAFTLNWIEARATPAAEHALLSAEHARNAGDEGLRSRALRHYLGTLVYGAKGFGEIADELVRLERDDPGPYLAACIVDVRGELARLAGSFDEARQLIQGAIDQLRAMGLDWVAAGGSDHLVDTELSAGNPAGALVELLKCDALLAEAGEHGFRSTVQARLSRVHELLGDRAAACAAIDLAEDLGGEDDVINFAITHAVRARLALVDGEAEAAERWARSAVEYAFRTDFPLVQAEAKLELARLLGLLGRKQEASSEAQSALELYRAKGDRPGASEARALLDELDVRA